MSMPENAKLAKGLKPFSQLPRTRSLKLENLLNHQERKIVNLDYEQAIILDRFGRILETSKTRDAQHCRTSAKYQRNNFFTHNHPDDKTTVDLKVNKKNNGDFAVSGSAQIPGCNLSPTDVKNFFSYGLKQKRAISKAKQSIYIFERNKPLSPIDVKYANDYLSKLQKLIINIPKRKIVDRIMNKLLKENSTDLKMLTKRLNDEFLNKYSSYQEKLYHRAYKHLAKKLNCTYTVKPLPKAKKAP